MSCIYFEYLCRYADSKLFYDTKEFDVSHIKTKVIKSVNLKYITVGRLDDDMIVPPSDGAMFILID